MLTGWKTALFGLAVAVVGYAQALDWATLIPNNPTLVGIVTGTIGVVIVLLRAITKTPIGQK
jgi:hypothetical protein